MAKREIDVVAAGHACLDIIPKFLGTDRMKVEQVFHPGKLVIVGEPAISTGGPVSNTGLALVKLGLQVSFMSKVGDDEFGHLLLERFRRVADVSGISISREEYSSYTVALAPPGIDRIFLHSPGTNNTFASGDVNYDLCHRARIFHLGYPPLMRTLYENDGQELVEIFRRVKAQDTVTSLDMALPDPQSPAGQVNWRKVLQNLLPYVDIFNPSIEEALFMAEREKHQTYRAQAKADERDIIDVVQAGDYTALSDLFMEWGSAVVTLKSGHRGFYVRTANRERLARLASAPPGDLEQWANREVWSPAYIVKDIASATGSGDSSLAGFLTAYLRGESPEKCAGFGNVLGYENLHALDAISSIKTWEESSVIFADRSLPRHDLHISTPGWREDKAAHLAYGPKNKQ